MKDYEKIEEALEDLESCVIRTPPHLRGVLLGDHDFFKIDNVLKMALKITKERDKLVENLYASARRSEQSVLSFINAVGKGDIIINKK